MNQPNKKKLSDVRKAELILRGWCAECFHKPGAHHLDCSAHHPSLQQVMDMIALDDRTQDSDSII